MTTTHQRPDDNQPADVLVIFGITGDLAKVMTFRSLYRLERRGLLNCPIVGVAVDDWTAEDLREHAPRGDRGHAASRSTRRSSTGFAERMSYVAGDFADPATYERVAARRSRDAPAPVFYLEIPPFLFGTVVKGLADAGLTEPARVVVEKPFGHDLASARALAAELHQYIDESQLYRIDHFLGKMGLDEILYLRFANAMLEPVWNRNYVAVRADHHGRELRGRGPRPLLRPGRRAARRGGQPPDAGRGGGGDGAAGRRRPDHAQGRHASRCSGRCRDADPAHYVRGQYDGYRDIDGVARRLHHRDLRRPASGDRQLALGRGAVLHPDRQAPAGHPDRAPAGLPATRPELGLRTGTAVPAGADQLVVKLDPSTGIRLRPGGPARRTQPSPSDPPRHGVRRRGGRGPDARTRCCCTPRCWATAPASPARTRGGGAGGSCSRCWTRRPPVQPTRPGSLGSGGRRRSWSPAYGRLARPWVVTS